MFEQFEPFDMDFNAEAAPLPSWPYLPTAMDCARCGLCVGACPTFRLSAINEETPKQRVRTLSKLVVDNHLISADERGHLDNCLQCRACEAVCPGQMRYGEAFDAAQAALAKPLPWQAKLALWLIAHKAWRNRLMVLLAGYFQSGLQALLQRPLRRSGLLKKLNLAEAEALSSPPTIRPLAERHPTTHPKRGQVALFTGCLAEHFDHDTLQATITLLNRLGYDVSVPSQQNCCGAIHQHNGQSAAPLMASNIALFNALEVDAVLYTASGCGAMLQEYPDTPDGGGQRFRQRLHDIGEFLSQHWPEDLRLLPLPQALRVHEPCSQRNVLKNTRHAYDLLKKIPNLEVGALADNHICCGAGGSYMLTHPDNAQQLRGLKRQAIAKSQADSVVSSNFGCTFFLNAEEGMMIRHYLLVLAGQLEDAGV